VQHGLVTLDSLVSREVLRATAPVRQVVATAITLLVLGTIGAIQAGLAGDEFMFDLELDRPALVRSAPVLDPQPPPRLARRVFLVIIDGMRLDKSYELPFLDELRRRGVDAEAQSHYPTFSRPNYVSILTGVPPAASGVRTNHHGTPVQLDSLMDRVHAAGMKVAIATDYALIPQLFLRPRTPGTRLEPQVPAVPPSQIEADNDAIDLDAYEEPPLHPPVETPDANLATPFDDARYVPWPGGFSEAGAQLVAGAADLVVLHIGAVDIAGHAFGGASKEYREAAVTVDHAIAYALARIDLARDAALVTADHGHTNRGGHGGTEPEVTQVPLILAGAGVRAGAMPNDARLIDIAPTIAALLGISPPGHGLGRTLTELLVLDDTARIHHQAADSARIVMTARTVELEEAHADAAVLEHRALRISSVIGGALLATLLAALLIRRRVMRLDLRVLAVSVPAFFIVYYAAIATIGQRFSPSLVPARGHITYALVRYGLIGMGVQLLASLWVLRYTKPLGERLATANGIVWTGLMIAMVTAGLVWAYFPPPYISTPSPFWMVAIPAALVAIACAALNFAITLAFEVIIFVARAWQRE
jgi:type I phosphodiesterase/nucleotide pyrophosphatase